MGEEIRGAALEYAGLGWAVLPLRARGKEPLTRHGLKDASTDPDQIRKWWDRWPDANVGVACGSASGGLVAIDLDEHEERGLSGLDTLHDWEREHGQLPDTATAITGGGGVHLLYRADAEVRGSANAVTGVDVRGDGSYIVAPPSIHPSGRRYEWEAGPDEAPVEALSARVAAFVADMRPSVHKGAQEAAEGGRIAQGQRNDTVYRFALSLRSRGLGGADLETMVAAYNATACDPPMDGAEVRRICASAMEKPAGLSGEARALQERAAVKTEAPTGGSAKKGRPDAAAIADELISNWGASVVDGIPSVVVDGRYAMGSRAIDRAVWEVDRRASLNVLREVQHRLLTLAPHKEQADPRYVGFANCVLDVETGAELPWCDSLVIPNVVPVEWDPAAECPEVDEFMERLSCGRADVLLDLQEVLGYCCYRSNEFGQAPVLVNPQGANGKSSFIKVARSLVGAENATAIDVNDLGRRFQAEAAAGKLVVLSDDTGAGYIEANSMAVVKKIITGDEVHTDVKGGKGYDFHPYATLIISANRLPRMQDSSGGTMRRWFPIPFDAHFAKGEPGFDPRAVAKVTTPEALRRVAVLAMAGLSAMRAEDGFTPNRASERMLHDIELDNSTVAQFVEDRGLTAEALDGKSTERVYESYRRWAEDAGVGKPLGRRSVTRELSELCRVSSYDTKQKAADGSYIHTRLFRRDVFGTRQENRGDT